MQKIRFENIFFAAVAVVILWRLLLPGYVLTLDMIFTPELRANFSSVGLNNAWPIVCILFGLNHFFPAWLIQKIILFFIFFCAGRFAFAYLPLPSNRCAKYFAALIYTVNPFVYGRFLAGHWTILAAYALLPVFIGLLRRFIIAPETKTAFKLSAVIFITGFFSPHFFVMELLIFSAIFIWRAAQIFIAKNHYYFQPLAKNTLICLLCLFVASSYWFWPAITGRTGAMQTFDDKHWSAFAASGHETIPVWANLAALGGFWAEGQPWANDFKWPVEAPVFWIALSLVAVLIAAGIIAGLRRRSLRRQTIFFCLLGVSAYVFATGAGETFFKNLNVWLYEHIFFWRGFRDSQKFIAWLALSAAVLAGWGASEVCARLERRAKYAKQIFVAILAAAAIAYGIFFWGGFHYQLRAVWYPESWKFAKKIIVADGGDFRVLILPWHGYFSLKFNDNRLTANPAAAYYGKKALVSQSIELEGVYDQSVNIDYVYLDEAIRNGDEKIAKRLATQNIKYIIYFSDLEGEDNYSYEFLNSPEFREVYHNAELSVYILSGR